MTDIILWNGHEAQHAARIVSRPSVGKVILKTKNDPFGLALWIEHHLKIFGAGNIIIFDNASTNDDVFNIYEYYGEALHVIGYDGYYDNLQAPNLIRPFYDAVQQSCDFFCFLDTDEFLFWIDGGRYFCDSSVIDALSEVAGGDFIPGTWLHNVRGHADLYSLKNDAVLTDGRKWGKPAIRSSSAIAKNIIHNTQLTDQGLSPASCSNLFVMHRNMLFKRQRITANINKLRAIGVDVSADGSVANPSNLTRQAATYADEIKQILSGEIAWPDTDQQAATIRIKAGSMLGFNDDEGRTLLARYLANANHFNVAAFPNKSG